jgi:hypothetical protein
MKFLLDENADARLAGFLIPFPLDSVMNLGCARFATGRDAWRNRPGRVSGASVTT